MVTHCNIYFKNVYNLLLNNKMKKITVDQKKCIGCGTCIIIAPDVFKFDKNGKSMVTNQSPKSPGKVKDAIESCPVEAISSEEI
jgi:ferredoxin